MNSLNYREISFTDGKTLPVGTMYCIGQNYALHAKEMGSTVSKVPVVFIKPPSAYAPSGSTISLPEISNNVHHEVELVVAIGRDGFDISQDSVSDYIEGYAVGIDLTLRDLQKQAKDSGKPWSIAKGFRHSAPISEFLLPSSLETNIFDIELSVNGKIKQKSSTSAMERSIEQLIIYLSSIFELRRGDLVFTGTPEGVGKIQSGDIMEAFLNGVSSLSLNIK